MLLRSNFTHSKIVPTLIGVFIGVYDCRLVGDGEVLLASIERPCQAGHRQQRHHSHQHRQRSVEKIKMMSRKLIVKGTILLN